MKKITIEGEWFGLKAGATAFLGYTGSVLFGKWGSVALMSQVNFGVGLAATVKWIKLTPFTKTAPMIPAAAGPVSGNEANPIQVGDPALILSADPAPVPQVLDANASIIPHLSSGLPTHFELENRNK